jgi:predicted nucleic acid-binding protein
VIFADSFYYFALINKSDAAHQQAMALGASRADDIATTEWVLVEVLDGLARLPQRTLALKLIARLHSDPRVRLVGVGEMGFEEVLNFYSNRPDQEWSFTDCASFIAMRRLGITEALTADHHFEQAGFRALLKP